MMCDVRLVFIALVYHLARRVLLPDICLGGHVSAFSYILLCDSVEHTYGHSFAKGYVFDDPRCYMHFG